ncbi:hypothetical protein [Nonlabens sp. Asnod2-A12]|uniref:hypothetical protein n=1 Tax=Nonlabens sp. Asnod2-A12 TaxID=3160578 RepID=UPI00386E85A5
MRLITRKILIIATVLSSYYSYSQENTTEKSHSLPDRVFAIDFYLQRALPSGDNFIGNGLSDGTGYGIRMQFDIYKNIYVGGALSQDFFSVKNTDVIGEFNRATKFNAYLFLGYDYQLNDDWNITADLGYGYSQNKNRQSTEQGGGKFRDTGNVFRITTSIEYNLSSATSIYLSPSYESISYNINSAPALEDTFDKGKFINLALGIRFNVRDYRNVPLKDADNQELIDLQNRDRDDLSISEKRKLYFLKKKEARRLRRERRRSN